MIQSLIGKKLGQVQGFLEDGKRIPMTRIMVSGNVVTQIKTTAKDGYDAVQLGFGSTKKADKPTNGHSKKAGLQQTPRFFRETKVDKIEEIELGSAINVEEVLTAGDIIDVSGISKGKGFAGVVKRHHFKGGPKTHGQSDRHRAPGSIGQSTTPGRVYKGKRMAGHMGDAHVTIKNLEVIEYADGVLLIKGLIPGPISSIVTITRRGTNKKHQGLYKEPAIEEITDANVEEVGPSVEEQDEMRKVTEEKAEAEEKAEIAAAQVSNQSGEASLADKVEDVIEKPAEEKKESLADQMKAEGDKKDSEAVTENIEKEDESAEKVDEK